MDKFHEYSAEWKQQTWGLQMNIYMLGLKYVFL